MRNYSWIHPDHFAITQPAKPYTRKAFNGWAQVIVQTTPKTGDIQLSIHSEGLNTAKIVLQSTHKKVPFYKTINQ